MTEFEPEIIRGFEPRDVWGKTRWYDYKVGDRYVFVPNVMDATNKFGTVISLYGFYERKIDVCFSRTPANCGQCKLRRTCEASLTKKD